MMRRKFSTVLFLALLVTLSGLSSAQDAQQANQDRCSLFKMRVIEPADAERHKLQVVKPDDRVDYKGIVIDPCAAPTVKVGWVEWTTPRTPNFFTPPTLSAKPSNDWFKAPSEMFKQFAPLKPPEKK